MNNPVLIFRADAGTQMGTGHLMRSSSLAALLADQFTCKLVTTCAIPALVDSIRANFSAVFIVENDSNEMALFLQEAGEQKLILLDGYHFDQPYQHLLQQRGFYVSVIDDLITAPVSADLILNHCGGISPLQYTANPQTVFALGTSYCLLSPVFQVPAAERRRSVRDKNCFVCLGGADPLNDTLQVAQKLVEAAQFNHIHLVTGAAYLHKEALSTYCNGKPFLHYHQGLSAMELKSIMQQCSFAVCSPSTIVHEYLSIGGVVWLKQIADNQKHILRFMTGEGLTLNLDKDPILLNDTFEHLFSKQAIYFDGDAARRLQKLFQNWATSAQIIIRQANEEDLLTTYQWINDPEVRNQSYSANVIPLESHTDWFLKKIKATDCFYYILLLADDPVAQIRFDISDQVATISYLTDKAIRGKGMGPWILAKGIQQLLSEARPAKIIGHVKKNNLASLRSFEKLAFEKAESTAYPDSITFTMTVDGNYN